MIDSISQTITLIHELFFDGFIALLAIACVAPILGTHLVMRRMPLLALAVPQLAGAGQAASFWLFATMIAVDTANPAQPGTWVQMLGALFGVAAGMAVLSFCGRGAQLTGAYAGLLFVVAAGLQEIFYLESPYQRFFEDAMHHGRVLTVGPEGRNLTLAIASIALFVAVAWSRPLWTTAFDPDHARLQGRSPTRWLLVILVLVGVFSALTVTVVGPEAVLALLLIPPTILRSATTSVTLYGPLASLAGILGVLLSFFVACAENIDWPLTPALILTTLLSSLLIAALASLFRRLTPQPSTET